MNLFNLANDEFLSYVGAGYLHALNPYPVSSGTTIDRFEGKVGYSSSWTDKDLAITGSGVKTSNVNYNKTFPMRVVLPVSIINSQSGLDNADMMYNSRGHITVAGDVSVDKPKTSIDATGYAGNYVNTTFLSGILCTSLCGTPKSRVRLDSANITQSPLKDSCSFSAEYSFDEPIPINPSVDYCQIINLRL